jgi:hypothetical protein
MTSFFEKIIAMLVAFCVGCYITADYLDRPFVEEQKNKIKDYFYNFMTSTD